MTKAIEEAISKLLQQIPDIWQAYQPDKLSDTEEKALFSLTAAGMVERRERLRLKMLNHPISADATITFTGECGGVEALETLIADLWQDWEKAFREWNQGDTAKTSPIHCQRLEPSEWRLTDQGVLAKEDLSEGNARRVFDFVLKQGFFDDQFKLVDNRISRRLPVLGKGLLVESQKSNLSTVNIGNWDEGADKFSKAIESLITKLFDAKVAEQTSEKIKSSNETETPVTLKEFIKTWCENGDKLSVNVLNSRVNYLNNISQNTKGQISLPDHVGEWKSGRAKRYQPSKLVEKWPDYCTVNPSLPSLKIQ